jgi:hypothetical protein
MPYDDLKPLGQHGGRRPGAGRPKKGEIRERKIQADAPKNAVNLKPSGSTVDYVIRRLLRQGHDDLAEAVINRKVSAYACSCLLGWRQRPATQRGEHSNQAKRRRHAFIDVKALIG